MNKLTIKSLAVFLLPFGIVVNVHRLRLYLQRQRIQNKREKTINQYFSSHEVKKLNIGCGDNILSGWLNTDLWQDESHVYLDASELFPFRNNTFDYIYSEHLFEHLVLEKGIQYLKESLRVLKPGGKIRIVTPDLEFVINLMKDKTSQSKEYLRFWYPYLGPMKYKYNPLITINMFFNAWGHEFIYNYKTLSSIARKVGFKNTREFVVGQSDTNVFKDIERHYGPKRQKWNKFETFVLEAQK